ncbi:MAG: hypothetical protein PHR11_04415, partial [Candidatus Omnitrophica bacterium]|nr:hypothetical protein [Candidatus Omnitrophota bacterium]
MQKNNGQALIVSYLAISVFILISAALSAKGVSERSIALRNRLHMEAFYMAEGATENAISELTSGIANYQLDTDIAALSVTTNFTTANGLLINSTISELAENDTLILEGQTNVWTRNYEIVTSAVHPQNAAINVTVHQIISRRLIPTFQHSVFYEDDLEVLPGANMNLSGRIHCNDDIYLDAESGKMLTIDSTYLRSAGDIYNKRKNTNATIAGDVNITANGTGTGYRMNNLDCEDSNWTTEAIARWNGTVMSSVHGVTELTAPSVASVQPGGYYASEASVVVTDDVITKDGEPLTPGVNCPVGTVIVNQTLYDHRENGYVRTVNIDLRKLANLGNEVNATNVTYPNNMPSNGLLYATATGTRPAIRLVNAAEIDRDDGLTVVSNDPVYIQGNYNSVNKTSAAVICDAINILSNKWNDSNSSAETLTTRVANETTINSAFIAGVDTTTSSNYNGGLENYPRLHEDWGSKNLNIRGSFVALWDSSIANGTWAYGGDNYNAP